MTNSGSSSMELSPDLEMSFSKLVEANDTMRRSPHPSELLCPVTNKLLVDPVIVRADCNHTVSRVCFLAWIKAGNKSCPCCQAPLKAMYAKTNKELKHQVFAYQQIHQSQHTQTSSSSALDASTEHTPLRSNTGATNAANTNTTHAKRGRRVALKVRPELQMEIQAHGHSSHNHNHTRTPTEALLALEKETSHSTLETACMMADTSDQELSLKDLLNDDSASLGTNDDSGRIHGSDSPNNWEDSCTSIDNIRCRTHVAPTSPTRGMVYKVTSSRPRGNSPAPRQRTKPMQRLLHAMHHISPTTSKPHAHVQHNTTKNNTIRARVPTQINLPLRLPFGTPLVTIGKDNNKNRKGSK